MFRLLLIFTFFVALVSGCESDEKGPAPVITIALESIYSLDEKQALGRAAITNFTPNNSTETGLVWAGQPAPTVGSAQKSAAAVAPDGTFSTLLEPLTLGQTYYVRAYIKSGEGYIYSNELTLTHRGPFVWRSLTGQQWYSQKHIVNGVNLGNGVVVVRLADEFTTEVWYYRAADDSWTQLKDLPLLVARYEPLLVNLNQFGREGIFFGGGYQVKDNVSGQRLYFKDFWELGVFSGSINDEFPSFPFGRTTLAHFTIDNRAFALENGPARKFAMLLNGISWRDKNDFPGVFRGRFLGFSIGDKGYILAEDQGTGSTKDLYEYTPDTDSWTRKADFPGENRLNGVAFSVNGRGYYGLGQSKAGIKGLRDIWEYDPTTNAWQKAVEYPGAGHVQVIANTVEDRVYLGFGYQLKASAANAEHYQPVNDYWELKF